MISNRYNVTLPVVLHNIVKAEAASRGLKVSGAIQQALTWWLVLAKLRSNGVRILVEENGVTKELILS